MASETFQVNSTENGTSQVFLWEGSEGDVLFVKYFAMTCEINDHTIQKTFEGRMGAYRDETGWHIVSHGQEAETLPVLLGPDFEVQGNENEFVVLRAVGTTNDQRWAFEFFHDLILANP